MDGVQPSEMSRMASNDPMTWSLGRLLSTVSRHVEAAWDNHLSGWGLSHATIPVLVHLLRGPRSQRGLAEACGVTEQTMGRTIERMLRDGTIQRDVHPADRRAHLVSLTDDGRSKVLEAVDPRPAQQAISDALTPEQQDQLRVLLATVVESMNLPHLAVTSDAGAAGQGAGDHDDA